MNPLDGIEGLKPVNPDDLAEYERAMREEVIPKLIEDAKQRRAGGLIIPPEPGCVHDWKSHQLKVMNGFLCYVIVKKCSKCHVLGDPPPG